MDWQTHEIRAVVEGAGIAGVGVAHVWRASDTSWGWEVTGRVDGVWFEDFGFVDTLDAAKAEAERAVAKWREEAA